MPRPAVRLAAGTLALVLPLAAAAGCGTQKKRTIKAELASAQTNLENSKAAAFTLRFDDAKGAVAALIAKDDSAPDKDLVNALLGGSVTYVVDPVSDKKLKDLSMSQGTSSTDLSKALEDVNVAFVIRDDTSTLGEVRLVDGTLYARVDLTEIGRLAKEGGVADFDAQVDSFIADAGPQFEAGLKDARAGKWLKLPLKSYLKQFQDLAKGFTGATPAPATGSLDAAKLGTDLFSAVKPYIKVTDAGDDASNRLLDVKVQARPALKAALAILKADKTLPFASALTDVTPADIDKQVAAGDAHGTITLKSGHLTQFTVDVESIRKLAPDPGKDSVAGSSVVFDIDDSADAVSVPTDVSTFDVGALLDDFLKNLGTSVSDSSSGDGSYSG